MKYLILIIFLFIGLEGFSQSARKPLILETVKDVQKIQDVNDWILVTTTHTDPDHDPDDYIKEYLQIMKAVEERVIEISEEKEKEKSNNGKNPKN